MRSRYPRLQSMQGRVQENGQRRGERFGPVADRARMMAEAQMAGARSWADRRVLDLRGWSAPRLVQAARFIQDDLGPRVSSMLIAAARRMEPPAMRRNRRIAMGMFVVGGFAAMLALVTTAGRGAERMMGERIDEEAAGSPTGTRPASMNEPEDASS